MKLPSIQTDHQGYGILELDNSRLWFEQLGLDATMTSNQQLVSQYLSHVMSASPDSLSGVVLDPELGLPVVAHKPAHLGILWELEEPTTVPDPTGLPKILPEWTVEHVRNNLGLAKLELQYHPAEAQALVKKKLIAEIHDFCQYQNVDFLLKLIIYSPTSEPLTSPAFQEAQLTAVQELRESCEIFALQSPQDALAAATLTAELDIPWLVASQPKQKYEDYKDQLRQALEAGARGFLVGETVWQEMYALRRKDQGVDDQSVAQFAQSTLRDRLIELHRILGECLAV